MVEESPCRSGRRGGPGAAGEVGGAWDCSGGAWRSCSGGAVADCVAICCCPCAVVSFLALALVKVPWEVGRRCLGIGKKRGKRGRIGNDGVLVERGGRKADVAAAEVWELAAMYEAERVWQELYRVGELGFGRVSCSGGAQTQQGKGN